LPLRFGGRAEVGRDAAGLRRGDADFRQGLIEQGEARFVEFDVKSVAGMQSLDVRLVAKARRIKGRAAQGLGKIGRQALIMPGMELMLEGMGGEGVFEAQGVPAADERQNRIETADPIVETVLSGHGHNPCYLWELEYADGGSMTQAVHASRRAVEPLSCAQGDTIVIGRPDNTLTIPFVPLPLCGSAIICRHKGRP